MRFSRTVPLLLASAGASAQSLAEALASQNSSLSALNALLQTQPEVVQALNGANNVTILAPNNDAIAKLLNNTVAAQALAADPGLIAAVLQYHVLEGVYYASNFTEDPLFIPTLLTNETYANVTGGQVVEAQAMDGGVTFYTGLRENSTVAQANVNFTGGTVHIIDTVLTVPFNDSTTLVAANLTAAAGALVKADLVETVSELRDVTIFAPSNDAFNAIGSLAANLSEEQVASILQYHVIQGTVAYSSDIMNMSVETVGGTNVTLTVLDGEVFVNSAKVILPDVLVSNGVVHVIDNVLNPQNTTAMPMPSATSNPPAFSGASTVSGGNPFTSGVPAPTTTVPAAQPSTTSSSTGLAVPMKTGAVAAAALFGGAAVFINM